MYGQQNIKFIKICWWVYFMVTTMHQWYQTIYCPTNAHNIKKRRVIKTF